jgi:hypothetical protein
MYAKETDLRRKARWAYLLFGKNEGFLALKRDAAGAGREYIMGVSTLERGSSVR